MPENKGKEFEHRFLKEWCSLPGSFALRLPDQQSGYYGTSANPCDFIRYHYPTLFLLELKTHQGNTFPFTAFRQYDKLKRLWDPNVPGIKIGVVLWMYSHDKIIYIPLSSFIAMEKDEKKSFNIKYLETQEYPCVEIPSTKLRTYLQANYAILFDLARTDQI